MILRASTAKSAIACLLLLAGGCVSATTGRGASNAVTAVKPETATIQYWIDQPVTTTVTADNYDKLWTACDHVAGQYLFAIDRTDYREGVLTTHPLISKYFTEFWRHDVMFSEDLAQSTIATYRRTIHFELHRQDGGKFDVSVKVIVERSSSFERRVTTARQFQDAFAGFDPGTEFYGDDGTVQPEQHWFAVGRDTALEARLGEKIEDALNARS